MFMHRDCTPHHTTPALAPQGAMWSLYIPKDQKSKLSHLAIAMPMLYGGMPLYSLHSLARAGQEARYLIVAW